MNKEYNHVSAIAGRVSPGALIDHGVPVGRQRARYGDT